MPFSTDQQTLNDLNIFGRHGQQSIYTIYNRCATLGGGALLEEMFRSPLSSAAAINRRSGTIRQLMAAKVPFPFQNDQLSAAEAYLANTDERTRLSAATNALGSKINHFIGKDAETAAIHKGITSLIALLAGMENFVKSLQEKDVTCYQPEIDAVQALLSIPDLEQAWHTGNPAKPSPEHMAVCDTLFRFRHRANIQQLLHHIHQLDVYLSIARVAAERNFTFAKALPAGERQLLALDAVYHPQVNGAVANTIQLTPAGNVVFVTGANMGGKSTFMKSVSIAVFLAHMGLPVAAAHMEFSVLDGMYTTINLPDNLGMGASHFYAEVLRVKKIARELSQDKNLFIVFDELFRGTNVKDAYDGTVAITAAFATKQHSFFFISTHIIEASDVLRQRCNNIRFVYLPTRLEGNVPVYTYQLAEGVTADRHGMMIITNEGILDMLEAGFQKRART